MYRDAACWKRVRAAIGMGMCRVIVRWVEYQSELLGTTGSGSGAGEDAEMDRVDHGERVGLGIGFNINGRGGRLTRNESRRRSQLGVCSEGTSGVAIGVGNSSDSSNTSITPSSIPGLGESVRSRGGVGSKDFDRKERGSGKVKRR
jgi:hypothetical protein